MTTMVQMMRKWYVSVFLQYVLCSLGLILPNRIQTRMVQYMFDASVGQTNAKDMFGSSHRIFITFFSGILPYTVTVNYEHYFLLVMQ